MKRMIYLLLSLWLVGFLVGCKTAKDLERTGFADLEKVTEYRDRYHLDSIFIRDSVIIRAKGDTVFKDRWRDRWRDRIIRDTVHVGDTIYIEKEVSAYTSSGGETGYPAAPVFRERTEPPNNWKEITILIIIAILIFKFK